MIIKRFNENNNKRYKVDLLKVFQNFKRRKNVQHILGSINRMIEKGNGTVYLYSITDNGDAYIKSDSTSDTLQIIPVNALIDFNVEDWELQKDIKKYNL